MIELFAAATANGTSDAIDWQSMEGNFWVIGTLDGATVTLEASPDGKDWLPAGATVTVAGIATFRLKPCRLRATVSNSGAGTNIRVLVI